MEQIENAPKKKGGFISEPLFMQSLKSNWLLWLLLTLGASAIFFVINVVIGSHDIFVNVDMGKVSAYVLDEKMNWLQIFGLLETMGFNLGRIEVMSRIDINSILSDLVYKIVGVLLPMIYVIITSNALIANQVNSGSMAYVLSTPTSRRKVICTQFLYLMGAVLAMYLVITGTALFSETIAGAIRIASGGTSNMVPLRTILLCFSSFSAVFALAGICFGASAFFNKTNNSLALGGGVCVISFICCILGLFGNKVFVSVGIGVESMAVFNYASVFTLIDTDSISSFIKAISGDPDAIISFAWIYECIGLLVGGFIFSAIGGIHFLKKDLPL